jgi:small subunit ribosomal protein S2
MKQLLEAGVHFGHQARRWNPKMRPYIYTERNSIYIIDLKKTLRLLRDACRYVRDCAAEGKQVLFVGTKKQARDIIRESADSANMHYVNNRWLGGLMTNFQTVRRSVVRMLELERMFTDGSINQYVKKEQAAMSRELAALKKNLWGIRNMDRLPDLLFVIDPSKEQIAVQEARKLGIPIVSVVDTNCNPDDIDWVIPGNDDAIRSIRLMAFAISEAVNDGVHAATEGEFEGEFGDNTMNPAAPGTPGEALSAEELEQRFNVYQNAEGTLADAPPATS